VAPAYDGRSCHVSITVLPDLSPSETPSAYPRSRGARAVGGAVTGDLTSSPLWNPDSRRPTRARTWSTYNIAALWIGMSVVITTYTLASGLMQQGMRWWQADDHHPASATPSSWSDGAECPRRDQVRGAISFPVLCRASFGVRVQPPAILRAIVA